MLKQEEMQSARKDARELEQQLTHALEEYLRFDYSNAISSQGTDIEQGNSGTTKLLKLESNVSDLIDKLSAQIDRMENMGNVSTQSVTWKAQISRLKTFLTSSQADFKRTREQIKSKLESAQLLYQAKMRKNDLDEEEDPSQRLYEKEREGIHTSMRMMDENIGRALAVQDAIKSQRERIRRATNRLANMADSIPGINQLIQAASRKKIKDNMIVAAAIAFFICVTLWWMVSG
jgi:hypothetical protein